MIDIQDKMQVKVLGEAARHLLTFGLLNEVREALEQFAASAEKLCLVYETCDK